MNTTEQMPMTPTKTPTKAKVGRVAPRAPLPFESSEDFRKLVDLLALYSDAHTRLDALQADANAQLLDVLEEIKANYALYQSTLTESEAVMESIALAHPDWFSEKRSVKTPFGIVKLHRSNKLAIPNEEASLARLEAEAHKLYPGPSEEAIDARAEFLAKYTRTEIALNKEALETEPDAFLTTLGIARLTEDNFSVKPAAIDLGKAVKESTPETSAPAASL